MFLGYASRFDGSVYPENLMKMFKCVLVLRKSIGRSHEQAACSRILNVVAVCRMAPTPQPHSILSTALLLASAATSVSAHGWMSKPKPRQMVNMDGVHENPDLTGSNGRGLQTGAKPGGYRFTNGPCGDPFEGISPLTNYAAQPSPVQAEYNAGDTIDVTANLNANHGGYFEVRVCGKKTGLTNECFEANKLERCCPVLSMIHICAGLSLAGCDGSRHSCKLQVSAVLDAHVPRPPPPSSALD
jgi:hypothetical protein